ncbi:hypothetical protein AOLI_G00221370 [Acnodon oligacanthus]
MDPDHSRPSPGSYLNEAPAYLELWAATIAVTPDCAHTLSINPPAAVSQPSMPTCEAFFQRDPDDCLTADAEAEHVLSSCRLIIQTQSEKEETSRRVKEMPGKTFQPLLKSLYDLTAWVKKNIGPTAPEAKARPRPGQHSLKMGPCLLALGVGPPCWVECAVKAAPNSFNVLRSGAETLRRARRRSHEEARPPATPRNDSHSSHYEERRPRNTYLQKISERPLSAQSNQRLGCFSAAGGSSPHWSCPLPAPFSGGRSVGCLHPLCQLPVTHAACLSAILGVRLTGCKPGISSLKAPTLPA